MPPTGYRVLVEPGRWVNSAAGNDGKRLAIDDDEKLHPQEPEARGRTPHYASGNSHVEAADGSNAATIKEQPLAGIESKMEVSDDE